ncbi:hypothetical protein RLEG12_06555 (plasmid) [Rhizobium leguminosarum bv. trifolii CB782]|nr:hypothetical protein RLEG12_06555 [Rhizobium leguminosarum bv. trifolii CB782]
MTTQRKVAEAAGISLKTVSRVINNDPMVNEQTRKKVREVIDRLGYSPHQAARMMRSQKSNIIGFLANDVATKWCSTSLISGAQDAAWAHDKQLMLFNVDADEHREKRAIEQLVSFRAEAVIYATEYLTKVNLGQTIDLPVILLNCFDEGNRYPAFIPDDYLAAFELTNEIIRRGAKNPFFFNAAPHLVAAQRRADGFKDACSNAGLDFSDRILSGALYTSEGRELRAYELASRILRGNNKPDVVLCGQDTQALQVYLAAAEAGLRVGMDLAIASFDNEEPICSILRPGLSTMALPYYEMGYAAVEAAISPRARKGKTLKCTFIDRHSLSNSQWPNFDVELPQTRAI